MPNLEELLNIAQGIAQRASDLIISYYNNPADWQITHKGQGEGDVTNADLAANKLILDGLQSACGTEQFAYISEETADDPQRLTYDWVWIIDPLDGTKGFIERSGEFAVHIGLVHHQRPMLGVVAFPAVGEIYTALVHQGAFCLSKDGTKQPITTSTKTDLQSMIAIVSRSHRNPAMDYVLGKLPKYEEQNVGGFD